MCQVCGSCCRRGAQECLGSLQTPRIILESQNKAAPGPMLINEAYMMPSRSMVTPGPKLLLLAMSGSVVLPLLGSVLMFIVQVNTGAHVNLVLNHDLRYKVLTEQFLPLADPGRAIPSHQKS